MTTSQMLLLASGGERRRKTEEAARFLSSLLLVFPLLSRCYVPHSSFSFWLLADDKHELIFMHDAFSVPNALEQSNP